MFKVQCLVPTSVFRFSSWQVFCPTAACLLSRWCNQEGTPAGLCGCIWKRIWFTDFTVCPGSSDPFYIVTYYMKWVTTSWTFSTSKFPRNRLKLRNTVYQKRFSFLQSLWLERLISWCHGSVTLVRDTVKLTVAVTEINKKLNTLKVNCILSWKQFPLTHLEQSL